MSEHKSLQLTLAVLFALCSGMVSDKRVFPTKDNCWVSLARKPMITDNKDLEKIFKPHKQVCLLNLPPAEKKTLRRSKTGNIGTLLLQFFLHMVHVRLLLDYFLIPNRNYAQICTTVIKVQFLTIVAYLRFSTERPS